MFSAGMRLVVTTSSGLPQAASISTVATMAMRAGVTAERILECIVFESLVDGWLVMATNPG
jgi:hypothetical protein